MHRQSLFHSIPLCSCHKHNCSIRNKLLVIIQRVCLDNHHGCVDHGQLIAVWDEGLRNTYH